MANSSAELEPVAATSSAAPSSRAQSLGRTALLVAGVAALIGLGRFGGGYVPVFREWVAGLGILGPAVFIAGYAVAVVAFVPGSALTLAAGAIFGLLAGVAWVFVGAVIGSCASFFVARYLARSAIERRLAGNARFAAIDRAVAEQGLRIVFLLRLSPVFPFNLLNYALGLTRVRFVDYALASFGMIPGTFLYVYLGTLGSEAAAAVGGARGRSIAEWVMLAVGLVATVVVTVYVTRIASRALRDVAA